MGALLPFPLNLLLSRGGLMMMGAALIAAVIGVQTLRLAHAKHDLSETRSSLTTEKATSARLRASVTASEQLRATEYAAATTSLSEAEAACAARVVQAHRSAERIRTLVEKPHAIDAKSGCPIRAMLSARELRDALSPGA